MGSWWFIKLVACRCVRSATLAHRSWPRERPSGERVPSGKMCTQSPSASRRSAARIPGWSMPLPRSTGSVCHDATHVRSMHEVCGRMHGDYSQHWSTTMSCMQIVLGCDCIHPRCWKHGRVRTWPARKKALMSPFLKQRSVAHSDQRMPPFSNTLHRRGLGHQCCFPTQHRLYRKHIATQAPA